MDFDSIPLTGTIALPPYLAVLAVDMERFSQNQARHQQIIGQAIPSVLHEAFARSDMLDVWKNARFPRHGGDGYVIGTEPEHLPFLISPFLERLQEVLREYSPRLAAHSRSLRLRLRASIDVGPLPDTGGRSPIDAMGEAMISTHRMLDSDPVRRELEASDPDTTLLAAIISRRVYEDAVHSGFTDVSATRWKPVQVDDPKKRFRAEGFLFVPTPSWRTHHESRGDHEDNKRSEARLHKATTEGADGGSAPADDALGPHDDRSSNTSTIGQNYGNAIQTGHVQGGMHFHQGGS